MDNLKVAILDDEKRYRDLMNETVVEVAVKKKISVSVDLYDTTEALESDLDTGEHHHIYLLDIAVPGSKNGIDAARKVRQFYTYEESAILFVSSTTNHYRDAFDVQPYGYVNKGGTKEQLIPQLESIIGIMAAGQLMYEFRKGRDTIILRTENILYLESEKRKITIAYKNGNRYEKIEYYGTLKHEAGKFPSPDFISPHASFLINIKYVSLLDGKKVGMNNGSSIPVAVSRLAEVRETIRKYKGKKFVK